MSNSIYTYRIKKLALAILTWELVFWSITGISLFMIGAISPANSKEQFTFISTRYFWLFFLIIPLIGLSLYKVYSYNFTVKQTNLAVRKHLFKPVSTLNSFLIYFFFRNALVFLIFALAQPSFGTKTVSGVYNDLELVVCLDVSNSMNAKDISPNLTRLEIAKRAMNELINKLHGEKIGVCVFAGSAFVQLPLTTDYHAAKLFISEIETNMFSNQGTNIHEALSTSINMFSKAKTPKGIILVTDGENHEQDPTEVLQSLKDSQIQLSILGLGTEQGGPVPINPNRMELGYKKTGTGLTVISRVDPLLLEKMARISGGKSSISSDAFPDLSYLLTQINQMNRTKAYDLQFDIQENRYQIPLFAALIFWSLFLFWTNNTISTKSKQ